MGIQRSDLKMDRRYIRRNFNAMTAVLVNEGVRELANEERVASVDIMDILSSDGTFLYPGSRKRSQLVYSTEGGVKR